MAQWKKIAIGAGILYFAAQDPHTFSAIIRGIITAFHALTSGFGLH